MNLEEQHMIRSWATREKLIRSGDSFTDNITKGEVLEMLYKLFNFDTDQGKTETYEEVK